MKIKYLHTMVRVTDIEESKKFYCDLLGLPLKPVSLQA
ncbi:VOC family protein [Amaricoccus macauensis]